MIIRLLTDTNYLDIDLKKETSIDELLQVLSQQEMFALETKSDTTVIINPINVIAFEIIKNIPPIQK